MILVFYSEIWIANVPHKSHECHSFRLLVIQTQLFSRFQINTQGRKLKALWTGDVSDVPPPPVLGLISALILLLYLIGPPKIQIQPKLQAQISGMSFTQGGRAESRRLVTSVTSSSLCTRLFCCHFSSVHPDLNSQPKWMLDITNDWALYYFILSSYFIQPPIF